MGKQTSWLMRFRGEMIPYEPRIHKRSTGTGGKTLPDFWLGFDSEAADDAEGFPEVQTFQTHNGFDTRLEYVKPGDSWRHFWSIIVRSIPEDQFHSDNKTINTVPVYCHNWAYDWGMCVKTAPEPWRTMSKMNHFYKGFKDVFTVERTKWSVTVEGGHMDGNAPTLSLILEHRTKLAVVTNPHRRIRLRLLDTFPFFPKALASVAKDLGMEKGDRNSVIGVDWRTVAKGVPVTAKNDDGKEVAVTKEDFEKYARHDPELVWHLAKRILEMHRLHGLPSLAVSGAGFSAKVMVRSLTCPYTGGYGGRDAVQLALDAFHGGRSGRLVHGHVEGMSVYDFRSSYPSIQKRLPALHPDYTLVYRHKDLPVEEFMKLAKKYHGFARVSGVEHDRHYPALLSADDKGSIRPVVGPFVNIPATAAEIYMGAVFGGLELSRVAEAVFYAPVVGLSHVRPFEEFIDTAWQDKNTFAKGTIEYDAAKIRANSGFGKQIEHRGKKRFVQDDLQIRLYKPGEEGKEEARAHFLNWSPDYWYEAFEQWIAREGETFGFINLKDLIDVEAEFGYYAVPQYAAWITGHAHARLVLMMRSFKAVKWDTDSVTTPLTEEEVQDVIDFFPVWELPEYIQPLSVGKDLGDLDMEGKEMSGVILGNKRYYLEGLVSKKGAWVPGHKEGHHGLPGIRKDDIKKVLFMESIDPDTGKVYFDQKPRPVRVLGAKDWREVGLFPKVPKRLKPKFDADVKQDFGDGGAYREFAGFHI